MLVLSLKMLHSGLHSFPKLVCCHKGSNNLLIRLVYSLVLLYINFGCHLLLQKQFSEFFVWIWSTPLDPHDISSFLGRESSVPRCKCTGPFLTSYWRLSPKFQFSLSAVTYLCGAHLIFSGLEGGGGYFSVSTPPACVAWRAGISNTVVVQARQAENLFLGWKGFKYGFCKLIVQHTNRVYQITISVLSIE